MAISSSCRDLGASARASRGHSQGSVRRLAGVVRGDGDRASREVARAPCGRATAFLSGQTRPARRIPGVADGHTARVAPARPHEDLRGVAGGCPLRAFRRVRGGDRARSAREESVSRASVESDGAARNGRRPREWTEDAVRLTGGAPSRRRHERRPRQNRQRARQVGLRLPLDGCLPSVAPITADQQSVRPGRVEFLLPREPSRTDNANSYRAFRSCRECSREP